MSTTTVNIDRPTLRSHLPSGKVPAPFILVEGEEKAGKTWLAVLLTADERVGRAFFLDLGEGTAEEYGRIPSARYEVLDHDGTYLSVLEQVLAVKAEAERAARAAEPPVALIVDTMGDVWDGLKDWVSSRARESNTNKAKLARDPGAELTVPRNLWNDADSRYHKIMNALLTMPAIVVGTARGKWVSATDPTTGQPYRDGRREYRVEGQKNLAYQATAWVRMTRSDRPQLVGCRSTHIGIKPGTDKPQVLDQGDNLLSWLVFDGMRFDPGEVVGRVVQNVRGGDLLDNEREEDPGDGRPEPKTFRRRQPKPDTRTPLERYTADLEEWQARVADRNTRRTGPDILQAKARAWDALKDVHPDWDQKRLIAAINEYAAMMGTTPADATVDVLDALTEQLAAEKVEQLRTQHGLPGRDDEPVDAEVVCGVGNPDQPGQTCTHPDGHELIVDADGNHWDHADNVSPWNVQPEPEADGE